MEAAAIIATVRATTSTTLQARTLCLLWKDAPRDVYRLRDDLDTCKSFLDSLESSIIESSFLDELQDDRGAGRGINLQREALRVLLSRGTNVANSLGDILVELIGEPEDTSSATSAGEKPQERLVRRKKLLWLRRVENVTKLRKLLRRTTDDIALCLTMLNVQITTINARGTATNIVTQLTSTIESSTKKIEGVVERSLSTLEERIQSQTFHQLEESFSAMSARLEDKLVLGLQRQQLESNPVLCSFAASGGHGSLEGLVVTDRQVPASPAVPHHPANHPRVPVLSRHSDLRCECPCHSSEQRPSTSRWELAWLQNVLGSLRVSYTGLKLKPRTDSQQHCTFCRDRRQGYTWIVLQWKLPAWLARAIVSMYFSQHDRPELLIRIHRIISTESASYSQSIIGLVHANDIEGVKTLVTSCPSSIHDVDPTGNSALLFAIGFRQILTVKFLLQAGADPFQESTGRNSPARYALMLSLRSISSPNSPERQIAAMMPLSNILDQDDYTDLHRVIIGVLPLDLQSALTTPLFRLQVNRKTTTGMTPLHLAARDCPTATEARLLLIAGADPNATAYDGATPLHWACRGGNEQAVRALLSAGASPQLSTKRHYLHETLLHAAVQAQECTASMIDVLLDPKHGIDINAVDDMGSTPVGIAAEFNRITALRHLIARGVDMDIIDGDGDTPLQNATVHRAHGAVKLLLGVREREHDSAGGDGTGGVGSFEVGGVRERYRAVNHLRGWGILHYLADFGDKEMMEIFSGVGMTGLPDPEGFTDLQGRTAGGIFRARIGGREGGNGGEEGWDGLVVAWRDLLGSINGGGRSGMDERVYGGMDGGDAHGQDEGSDSDDEFFDVLES